MKKTIVFEKTGYDPFIGFIKAYAIMCVLAGHTIGFLNDLGSGLWLSMQVPLFVLIQVFHIYKKDTYRVSKEKIFWRILFPYIVLQLCLTTIFIVCGKLDNTLLYEGLAGGGYGPGSYYPWVYIQLAILIPLIRPVFKIKNIALLAGLFILLCEFFEIISSLINLPDRIHRLLATRYFLLVFLGWLWVNYGIVISWKTIFISLLSAFAIIYFEYFHINDEPFFYSTGWSYHRWPCYFWVAWLGCYLLYLLYCLLYKYTFIDRCIKLLAKCSYEIFLIQMAACVLCPNFSLLGNPHLGGLLRTLLIFIISIGGGYYTNAFYKKFLKTI